jgi:hypothetical protein
MAGLIFYGGGETAGPVAARLFNLFRSGFRLNGLSNNARRRLVNAAICRATPRRSQSRPAILLSTKRESWDIVK